MDPRKNTLQIRKLQRKVKLLSLLRDLLARCSRIVLEMLQQRQPHFFEPGEPAGSEESKYFRHGSRRLDFVLCSLETSVSLRHETPDVLMY
jgi:hypothetical protein